MHHHVTHGVPTTPDGLCLLGSGAGRPLTFCPTRRREELPSVTGLSSAAAASLMSSFSTATSFSTSLPTTCAGGAGCEALMWVWGGIKVAPDGWVRDCTLHPHQCVSIGFLALHPPCHDSRKCCGSLNLQSPHSSDVFRMGGPLQRQRTTDAGTRTRRAVVPHVSGLHLGKRGHGCT